MSRIENGRIHLSGQEARGGEIVLRTPLRRAIFFGGLIGAAILCIIGSIAALA